MTESPTAAFKSYLLGDARAFDALVAELRPTLERYLAKDVDCREDRKDIISNVFLRLFQYRGSVPEHVVALALEMARGYRVSLHRRKVVRREVALPDATPASGWPAPFHSPDPGPATRAAASDQIDHDIDWLRVHLLELPKGQLQVILLLLIGLSHAEIAARLATTEAAVKNRRCKALKRLREARGLDPRDTASGDEAAGGTEPDPGAIPGCG